MTINILGMILFCFIHVVYNHYYDSLTVCRQLLWDCGIGLEVAGQEEVTSVVGQHRALIFCQYKSMLDIIERDLFKYVSCNKWFLCITNP